MSAALAALRTGLRWLSYALLALLIAMPMAQIVLRGVFNVPMAGAEELTRYFLICAVFLAAPLVTCEGGQISMQELQAQLPARLRWWVQLFIELGGTAFFALMTVAAVVTIGNNLRNQTATLEMPFWLFMAPLVVGMALLSLETGVRLARLWRRGRADDTHTVLT